MTKRTRAARNHEIKGLHEAAGNLYAARGTLAGMDDQGELVDRLYVDHQTLLERAKRIAFSDPVLEEAWVEALDEDIQNMRECDRRTRAARR